ncbi:MAG TPA: hypothetical protein VGL20_01255, partial [Candidatus Dormibacteraeota bacterium]
PVLLEQCDVHCNETHDVTSVRPGSSTTVYISNAGIPVGYLITSSPARVLGCLTFRYDHQQDGLTMKMSQMEKLPATRCPREG